MPSGRMEQLLNLRLRALGKARRVTEVHSVTQTELLQRTCPGGFGDRLQRCVRVGSAADASSD